MLSHEQRAKIRTAVKSLFDTKNRLEEALRKGQKLDQSMINLIGGMTGTRDPERQLVALEEVAKDAEKTYHEKLRQMAPNDLTAFAEYMNPEEYPARHHIFLCETLLMPIERREIMRGMVSLPPGHGKSVYCSRMFPAWYMGKHPRHRYIQAGHTHGFCEKEFGAKTKAIIDSDRYRDVFPEVRLAHDAKANGYWGLARFDGTYLTRGVGQGIAGFRAHCAGVDDPFATREDAESETVRNKVFNWFSADFTTRLLPTAPMFIVATRWNRDDLCGRVEQMNKEGKGLPWIIINLPALAEDEHDPLGRILNEPLWPEFYTIDTLLNLKATLPARDWNSLYRGRPTSESGGIVKADWIKRFDRIPEVTERRRVVISVDSAIKATKRSDFTVVQVWIETFDRKHHLVHQVRTRVEFPELVSLIETTASVWNADVILIEDKGSGTQYHQTRAGKAPAPIVPINVANTSKEFRFDGVSPLFEVGVVLVPQRAEWLAEWEEEILDFPNAAHDDQVDATSQYLAWAREKTRLGTKKLQGKSNRYRSKDLKEDLREAMRDIEERASKDPIHQQILAQKASVNRISG